MSIPRLNDRHCTSFLDEEEPSLTLRIRAWLFSYREFTETQVDCERESGVDLIVTHRCEEATDEIISDVKSSFRSAVAEHWDNKFVLVDYLRGRRTREVSCRVEVEFENSQNPDIHLRICLLVDPRVGSIATHGAPRGLPPPNFERSAFRSNCYIGGSHLSFDPNGEQFDMNLAWRTTGENWFRTREVQTSDQELVLLSQNTAAHEFGHYLGLQHTCYVDGAPSTDRCSTSEYCGGGRRDQLANIMAVGNEHSADHARPWIERLAAHGYMRHISWSGALR